MTKTEAMRMMRLLSAVETAMLCGGKQMPDHLYDDIAAMICVLEKLILATES